MHIVRGVVSLLGFVIIGALRWFINMVNWEGVLIGRVDRMC